MKMSQISSDVAAF